MTVINNDRETELDTAAKVLAHAFKDLPETRKDPATDTLVRELREENERLKAACAEKDDALAWALSMDPSPCRCMTFSTPPHVCKGHRALAGLRAETPASDGV